MGRGHRANEWAYGEEEAEAGAWEHGRQGHGRGSEGGGGCEDRTPAEKTVCGRAAALLQVSVAGL